MSASGALARVDLPATAGPAWTALPPTLRILLENVARTQEGEDREAGIAAILRWTERRTSTAEIPVRPVRLLMHDSTSTPALVDIAAMRDVLAGAGGDPAALVPSIPVDVSIDHSLSVEVHARPDAARENLAHELRRNAERYRFLKWAAGALPGVRIHPPGTGIMHTLNLEQLATVVATEVRDGREWAVPDLMIGTDSHTPMVGGLGVLAWGVGGLEAQAALFGVPLVLRVPDVVGVELTGRLAEGTTATDLALVVTHRLRALGVAGCFVEFFGPGVATLSAGERCVVANMAPEYGATTAWFPIDGRTVDYLRETGRAPELCARVEDYARRNGLWLESGPRASYTREIAIDLATVGWHVAGPRRPQDLHAYGDTAAALSRVAPGEPHRFPIAIAAITSCTNTSDPRLLVAAGLVARKALGRGLRVPAHVKTSLSPGSPAARRYLARSGLERDLAALGFDIVGFGCATCIGNSGPLPAQHGAPTSRRVAVLSGNRNFPGRIHPELDLAFLMSPPMVVAFALAGDAARNLRDEPVQGDTRLADIWPSAGEVDAVLAQCLDPADFGRAFREASSSPQWAALESPAGARFDWNPASAILRPPPFTSRDEGTLLGRYAAWPLLVLGDDVTTDHISPASAIPADSLVADFLVERGEDRADLDVFASRGGNWEVMVRAAFHSRTLVNRLAPGSKPAHTLHVPSGEVVPLHEAARRYRESGEPVVIVAGERYGTGTSRDWAAKGPRLLGVRAVLAGSFERIHRTNLVGMGILPVVLPDPAARDLRKGDRVEVDADPARLAPRAPVPVTILRRDGSRSPVPGQAAVETRFEVALLRAGGVIPYILRQNLGAPT